MNRLNTLTTCKYFNDCAQMQIVHSTATKELNLAHAREQEKFTF